MELHEISRNDKDEPSFRLVDFLTKRLDHTLTHSQASTRHIYLVNAAILAAIYYAFSPNWALWASFAVGAAFTILLSVVNWLHANFLNVQNAWYEAIDEEIRNIFMEFETCNDIWPERLEAARDRILSNRNRCPTMLCFPRTQDVQVWVHLVLSMFLLLVSVVFIGGVVYLVA